MIHLHVLLVDDETEARQTVEAALALDAFFTVRDCACGAEALTAAVAWRPDLILLDVMMADMDGPTVLARLRADKRTAPIPVVFLTALPSRARAEHFLALGVAGVIAKPFDPTEFAAEVRRFVAVEGMLSPAREGFLRRLRADAQRPFGLPSGPGANAAGNRGDADQRNRPFAGGRRRHLRVCRHYLCVGGAVGRRRKQSCRACQADRCRARAKPAA